MDASSALHAEGRKSGIWLGATGAAIMDLEKDWQSLKVSHAFSAQPPSHKPASQAHAPLPTIAH
jgi:hypothetical protein